MGKSYKEISNEYKQNKAISHVSEDDRVFSRKKTKRTVKKAKHKHNYVNCIFETKVWDNQAYRYVLGSYCPICGKIGDFNYKEDNPFNFSHFYLVQDKVALKQALDYYPLFFNIDIFKDKYVEGE